MSQSLSFQPLVILSHPVLGRLLHLADGDLVIKNTSFLQEACLAVHRVVHVPTAPFVVCRLAVPEPGSTLDVKN